MLVTRSLAHPALWQPKCLQTSPNIPGPHMWLNAVMKFLMVFEQGACKLCIWFSLCFWCFSCSSSTVTGALGAKHVSASFTAAGPVLAQRKCSKNIPRWQGAREKRMRPCSYPWLRTEGKYNLSWPHKPLYSTAFLPQAAGTFFPTLHACRAANVPCVVCVSFTWLSICCVSWTEW